MRDVDLPSPGTARGMELRRMAANYISELQRIAPKYPNGKHPGAATLVAFFAACSAAVDGSPVVIPPTPSGAFWARTPLWSKTPLWSY